MKTLKQRAMAFVGAVALGGSGAGLAAAADVQVEPGPPVYQRAAPHYVPAPVDGVYQYAPPPVVYRYAPPPPAVVYYDYPPPVVVYPPRYRYGYEDYRYPRHPGYRAYGRYVERGYGYRGRHWHR